MKRVEVRLLNAGGFDGMGKFKLETILNANVYDGAGNVVFVNRSEIAEGGGFPQCEQCVFVIGTECEVIEEKSYN